MLVFSSLLILMLFLLLLLLLFFSFMGQIHFCIVSSRQQHCNCKFWLVWIQNQQTLADEQTNKQTKIKSAKKPIIHSITGFWCRWRWRQIQMFSGCIYETRWNEKKSEKVPCASFKNVIRLQSFTLTHTQNRKRKRNVQKHIQQ